MKQPTARAQTLSANEPVFQRYFTEKGLNPFDAIEWEKRNATISDARGNVIFNQDQVEIPKAWSQTACNIAVSKYFRGRLGTPERETSARDMVGRVAQTIAGWGSNNGYFRSTEEAETFEHELAYLLVNQYAAFNSPVWFNVGVEKKPQCSACQPYNALVNTVRGFVPIGEIVEKNEIGLPVFDGEGLTQVVAVKNNGRKPVYRIRLNDGFFIEATGDHVVCAHAVRRTQSMEWKRVDQLKAGMHMRVYPRATAVSLPATERQVAEAALAGWLQADGFVGQYETGTNQSLTLEFMTVNSSEYRWIVTHLDTVFPNIHRKTREFKTKNEQLEGKRIRLYGEALRPFAEKYELLKRGHAMRAPSIMWTAPKEAVAAYLKSIFQSEGYATMHGKSAHLAISMISQQLVEDAQLLLTRLGVYSRVRKKLEARPDRRNLFELDISVHSEREKFLQEVGFVDSHKNGLLSQSVMLQGTDCPDIRYSEIVSIEPLGEMEVYDIQTQSGRYLSNSALVHNCFINSVKDDMRSILQLAVTEGMLFKYGSGTGTNLSVLRSSREHLSFSSGKASGPVSFMKGFDTFAGVIRSGGKTRRAAKMVILNVDHPDIAEFINSKPAEEKKAWVLMDAGYDGAVDGEAYGSVFFQNANHSVRATDAFMHAVVEDKEWVTKAVTNGKPMDTYKAREVMRMISEATYVCGDPGMQFDTTINRWHTCKNSERINASNPCVTGDTKVLTRDGRWKRIDQLVGEETELITNVGELASGYTKGSFKTGTKPVYKLETRSGYEVQLTGDHKVYTANRSFVPAAELSKDDVLCLPSHEVSQINEIPEEEARFHQLIGLYMGDGCGSGNTVQLTMDKERDTEVLETMAEYVTHHFVKQTHTTQAIQVQKTATSAKLNIVSHSAVGRISKYVDLTQESHEKTISQAVFGLSLSEARYVLQGLFTADGTVANYGDKSQYVALDSTSLQLLKDVQVLLTGFGIKSKIYPNRRAGKDTAVLPDGHGGLKEYAVKEMHSLRISRSSRLLFEKNVGFMNESYKSAALHELNERVSTYEDAPFDYVERLEYVGEKEVFDLTEPLTSSFIANGLSVHNCSEYMFIDDTACNLASLNLMKFRLPNGTFNVEAYQRAIEVMITAMEIIVGSASYPTEAIGERSEQYRTLGLGYANLGALLMSNGLAYDSEEGRNFSAAVTALLSGHAYATSAKLAARKGTFERYPENKEPMLDVMDMHRKAANAIPEKGVASDLMNAARKSWDAAYEKGETHGFRNAQISVLAPTGTIGFLMDCDTTGVEPDIALVKYKWLVGGGMMKIVNQTVPEALKRLGYSEPERKEILQFLEKNDTIEGAPHLKEEHLSVFDCAFRPKKGKRSIDAMGHIKMMGAVQPFISGAISKTVNVPEEITTEEISGMYMEAWKLGVKAIAIYRDGSKRTQPLTTQKSGAQKEKPLFKPVRRRLLDERQSITHKFSVNNYEGYLTVGLYEDGNPGEIFITMSKEGSTISGLTDAFATSVSMALQYGVPLRVLTTKFLNSRFEPSGFTHHKDIKTASSIVDYIFRWLALKFLSDNDLQDLNMKRPTIENAETPPTRGLPVTEDARMQPKEDSQVTFNAPSVEGDEKVSFGVDMDAPPCRECGSLMVRNGSCFKCFNCGSTSGCS
ncbi:hypothetical protein KJ765_00430 [Candidatus Micrarchaeota archaeon]|nr:hypothetical protein [Candidatus Micrarchaeota archaeon]